MLVPPPDSTGSEDSSVAKGFGISDLASLGFGQVGQLLDTMDMMSKTWSAMALPAALDPGASIDDLDKRINDLRAIEQWLSLNQNMLRNTIQALEVQRGTLAALQSFGQAMGASESRTEGAQMPWDPARMAALFAAAQRPAEGASTTGAPATGDAEPDAAAAAAEAAMPRSGPEAASAAEADPARTGSAPVDGNPLAQAWWNMLNEQFQHLASAAGGGMVPTGEAAAGAGAPAATDGPPATARRARKTKAGAPAGRKRASRST